MVFFFMEEVDHEKDVGVLLHKSFRPSMQCASAAKKANSVLGQREGRVKRTRTLSWGFIELLYGHTWSIAPKLGLLGQLETRQ